MTTNSGRPLTPVQISPVEDIVADLRAGRIVIMVDDEDRENEGDMICAADMATPEIINFMTKEARGCPCAFKLYDRRHFWFLPL